MIARFTFVAVIAWSLAFEAARAKDLPNATAIDSVKLDQLQGQWSHVDTGETITVSGKDLEDSRLGQARIDMTVERAANIVVVYQNHPQCYFYATFTDSGNRVNLAVRNKNQDRGVCQSGLYERVVSHADAAPADFLEYTGPSFDVDPRKVKEDFPSGKWTIDDKGYQVFVIYGTLLNQPMRISFYPTKDRKRFLAALFHSKVVSQVLRYQTDQDGSGTQSAGGSTFAQVDALCGAYLKKLQSTMVDKIGSLIGKPKIISRIDPKDAWDQPVCSNDPGQWICDKSSFSSDVHIAFDDARRTQISSSFTETYTQAVQKAVVGQDQFYKEKQKSCTIDVVVPELMSASSD